MSFRGRGRPTEKFRIEVKGLDDVIQFLEYLDGDEMENFIEELVEDTAKQMMKPGGSISIKSTREFGGATGGGHIPVDTGLLKAVFGAIDGKPNTGYYTRGNEAERIRKLKGRSADSYVIWEKVGKYQLNMGTTLYYASTLQQKIDFMGSYLRSHEENIQKYAQGKTNRFVDKMGVKFGFSRKK